MTTAGSLGSVCPLNFKGLLFKFNFFVLRVWLNVSAQIPSFLMILTTMVSSKGKREWK